MKGAVRHIKDLGSMGLASTVATLVDLCVFTALLRLLHTPLVTDTALAALAGATVHFTLCKTIVFGRFRRHVLDSAWRYLVVSGTALLMHTTATTIIASVSSPEIGWAISKGLVFLFFIYPASRYFVFGGELVAARQVTSAVAAELSATVDGED